MNCIQENCIGLSYWLNKGAQEIKDHMTTSVPTELSMKSYCDALMFDYMTTRRDYLHLPYAVTWEQLYLDFCYNKQSHLVH